MKVWIVCLLVSTLVACSWAAAAAAVEDKAAAKNTVQEETKSDHRQSKAMKSDVSAAASYNSYAPNGHPVPTPVYNPNDQETTMGFVYYYLPTVEKYYPKVRDFMPFFKRYEPMLARVSKSLPSAREITARVFDAASAVGLAVLVPGFVITSVGFLGFMGYLIASPVISAFGRRRFGRDVSYETDDDDLNQVPIEQSRTIASLAARIDNMIEGYRSALVSDTCLEKISCEAGQLTSRVGKAFMNPIIA